MVLIPAGEFIMGNNTPGPCVYRHITEMDCGPAGLILQLVSVV